MSEKAYNSAHPKSIWKLSKEYGSSNIPGPMIGIDLGTSNSCIAMWYPERNRSKIIKNLDGGRTTPSTIRFGETFDDTTVGVSRPPLVSGFKLTIGLKQIPLDSFSSFTTDHVIELDNYGNVGLICYNLEGERKIISPEFLTTQILSYLKESSEAYFLKKPVKGLPNGCNLVDSNGIIKRAVIGIPAYFTEQRIEATRRAAINAGFEEVHFLIESSAAAMAYGLLVAGTKTVLVFDIGGGTTDITILHITDGRFEVMASGGHGSCGGRNMDTLLVHYLLNKLFEDVRPSITIDVTLLLQSLSQDDKDELILLSSRCKEVLSEATSNTVQISKTLRTNIIQSYLSTCTTTTNGITNNKTKNNKRKTTSGSTATTANSNTMLSPSQLDMIKSEVLIYRNDFETIIVPITRLVERTVLSVMKQFSTTQSLPRNNNNSSSTGSTGNGIIDEVVLVGGASRVPSVREALRRALVKCGMNEFKIGNKGEFCTSINADEAVAQGLSIRAGILMGVDRGMLKDLLMLDALPTTIGIRSYDYFPTTNTSSTTSSSSTLNQKVAPDEGQDKSGTTLESFFEPILLRGSRLPATNTKTFALEYPTQKYVSLDVFEESCEDGNDDDENEQKIELLGTYDIPIPIIVVAAAAESDNGNKKVNNSSTNKNFVDVTFVMSEDRHLTFTVTRKSLSGYGDINEKNDHSNKMSYYTVIFLVCYVVALGLLYIVIKVYIRDPSSIQSNSNSSSMIFDDILESVTSSPSLTSNIRYTMDDEF